MRIGRREKCAICGGRGEREVWIGDGPVLEDPEMEHCWYCRGEGSVLLIWFGLRCVPLHKAAKDPGLAAGVGL